MYPWKTHSKIVHKTTSALAKTNSLTQIDNSLSATQPQWLCRIISQQSFTNSWLFGTVEKIKIIKRGCLVTPHHDKTFSTETILSRATDESNIRNECGWCCINYLSFGPQCMRFRYGRVFSSDWECLYTGISTATNGPNVLEYYLYLDWLRLPIWVFRVRCFACSHRV